MSANERYYATPESIMTDRQMYEASEAAFKRVCKEADTALAELADLTSSSGSDHIAAKYWKQRQDARNELERVKNDRDDARAERDAALARTGLDLEALAEVLYNADMKMRYGHVKQSWADRQHGVLKQVTRKQAEIMLLDYDVTPKGATRD